jgi:hypothetical protein
LHRAPGAYGDQEIAKSEAFREEKHRGFSFYLINEGAEQVVAIGGWASAGTKVEAPRSYNSFGSGPGGSGTSGARP